MNERDTLVTPGTAGFELAALLSPGALFHGRYRIARVLGGGAMGAVFGCHDEKHGRTVAVKVLHPALMAQPALIQRFRREAEVARRIRHPSIVEVISYGRSPDDGLHYLVMELLEGEDLEERLERGVDEPNRLAVEVMSALLGALWVAHEAGIVHRDVKPANIFLWRSGAERGIKVLDFGLARDTKDDASLTRTGELVGTPLYMSPEQASGERADARADLYSAGCVAYQLFCGRPPHQKSSPQMTMLAHIDDTPDPPTAVRKELPPSVDRLILRALEKAPDRRFRTASEMLEALTGVAADLGIATDFEQLSRSAERALQILQESWSTQPLPRDDEEMPEPLPSAPVDALARTWLSAATVPRPAPEERRSVTAALPLPVDPASPRGRRWPLWVAGMLVAAFLVALLLR